jgi:hypothetical protein
MTEEAAYTPPEVWKWVNENGGKFVSKDARSPSEAIYADGDIGAVWRGLYRPAQKSLTASSKLTYASKMI